MMSAFLKFISYWLASLLLIIAFPFNLQFLYYFITHSHIETMPILITLVGALFAFLLIFYSSLAQTIYIVIHECSHALSVILTHNKIYAFKVGKDHGYVKTNKTNLFIRLSPYLFPLAPALCVALHYLCLAYDRYHQQTSDLKTHGIIFLFAFFYTITTYYNVKLIYRATSDIDKKQITLSLLLIYNFYVFISIALFYLLFNAPTLLSYIYYL